MRNKILNMKLEEVYKIELHNGAIFVGIVEYLTVKKTGITLWMKNTIKSAAGQDSLFSHSIKSCEIKSIYILDKLGQEL